MSSTLYWEPVKREKKSLSDALKRAMQNEYGFAVNINMGEHDEPYLRGLLHAGICDAGLLLEAIHQHGEISVKEES